QHREPRGGAGAEARSHSRRRLDQRDVRFAGAARAGADRHFLCLARRTFRCGGGELSHAWATDASREGGRGAGALRRRHDENGQPADRFGSGGATPQRLLRARAARSRHRTRRFDQCGDDRISGRAQRRGRTQGRPGAGIGRAGSVVESRCDRHHRPRFRGGREDRSGVGIGCGGEGRPRAPVAEAAVRLGRFSAVGQPARGTVVACEDSLSGAVS
ncbi:unnamed protein product, partial [Phaeothamnion confervicola]